MQERKVVAALSDAVGGRPGVPPRGMQVVLSYMLAGGVENAELQASRTASTLCGLSIPRERCARIARGAESTELQRAEVVERVDVAVRHRAMKPVGRRLEILRQPSSFGIQRPQPFVRGRHALIRRFREPAGGFTLIDWHTVSREIELAEQILRFAVAEVRGLPAQSRRGIDIRLRPGCE